tara:strand:+ start:1093 stop:1326 length:234 start_codon:yes stop_codon:yes gene_type:complete
MMWVDYNITQMGENFRVEGDWPGEVMGEMKDGTKKESVLYRPGDVFIVNEGGWLVKSDELSAMILKHDTKKAANDEV